MGDKNERHEYVVKSAGRIPDDAEIFPGGMVIYFESPPGQVHYQSFSRKETDRLKHLPAPGDRAVQWIRNGIILRWEINGVMVYEAQG